MLGFLLGVPMKISLFKRWMMWAKSIRKTPVMQWKLANSQASLSASLVALSLAPRARMPGILYYNSYIHVYNSRLSTDRE